MKNQEIKREKGGAFLRTSWRVKKVDAMFKVDDLKEIAEKAFKDKTLNIVQHKRIIRLCGQSGAGKSSQLLPAALSAFKNKGIRPVHIAVREFVKYHPYHEEIKKTFGEKSLRENTNNFALTLAFFVVEKLIKKGYPVLFEITLLDKDFENYLAELAAENGYESDYHVLAVPRKISDDWIEKRNKMSTDEKTRKVLTSSRNYFYERLPKALIALKKTAKKASCTIWSGDEKMPIFVGKMENEEGVNILEKYRKKEMRPHDATELLKAKIDWFIRYQAI